MTNRPETTCNKPLQISWPPSKRIILHDNFTGYKNMRREDHRRRKITIKIRVRISIRFIGLASYLWSVLDDPWLGSCYYVCPCKLQLPSWAKSAVLLPSVFNWGWSGGLIRRATRTGPLASGFSLIKTICTLFLYCEPKEGMRCWYFLWTHNRLPPHL